MASYRLGGAMDRRALIGRYPRLSDEQRRALARQLVSELGPDAVISDPDLLLAYSYDATGERHFPDVVVMPADSDEVSRAVAVARRMGAPIVGRGASTNLSGGTTPLVGGMVVSFARMNRILDLDLSQQWVRVQPGVVNADLQVFLGRHGYVYPPDPSSHRISTLGGNIAENSGGPHCVKYGVTTQHVLALEVILVDGRRLWLPRSGDTFQTLDLTSLVIGSEGTLALVTEALLSIQPLPPARMTLLAAFASVDDATRAVSAVIAERIQASALELMDKESLRIVESYVHAGYPVNAGAVLLIELDGTLDEVERAAGRVEHLMERHATLECRAAQSESEAEALWRGRRAHYGAIARLAPHIWVQDVTVPRPRLAEMMDRVLTIAARHDMLIVTAAHAGDGNLHPSMPYNPADAGQVQRLKSADRDILKACVEMGGAITGEHGIGIDKAEHLPLMYGPDELTVMNDVKSAFDPENRLNPFKALWPAEPASESQSVSSGPLWAPENESQLSDMMGWARAHGQVLKIQGQGRRTPPHGYQTLDMRALQEVFDWDGANLSVEVGAGMPAGALARLLSQESMDLPGVEPFMDDTVGGLVAHNAPYWRLSTGRGWRDQVLAVEWVDARGRRLKFGRKTMKNVAGYDLAKLMTGSEGRLGAIARVTFRIRPAVEAPALYQSEPMPAEEAFQAALRLIAQPNRPDGVLLVKAAGGRDVSLWCTGGLATRPRRPAIEEIVGKPGSWSSGSDGWLQVEQERLHQVYRATADGLYQRGMLPLDDMQNSYLRLMQNASSAVFCCPGPGWYEILGSDTSHLAQTPLSDEALHLAERVTRVFDPDQILR